MIGIEYWGPIALVIKFQGTYINFISLVIIKSNNNVLQMQSTKGDLVKFSPLKKDNTNIADKKNLNYN